MGVQSHQRLPSLVILAEHHTATSVGGLPSPIIGTRMSILHQKNTTVLNSSDGTLARQPSDTKFADTHVVTAYVLERDIVQFRCIGNA